MGRHRTPLLERILSKLEVRPAPITHDCLGRPIVGPCHVWTGSPRSKYGMVYGPEKVPVLVHRTMYELFVGPISGQVDHLCRVHKCAQPTHLEDVAQRENLRRHMLTREHVDPLSDDPDTCLRGHPRTPDNTRLARMYGGRMYPICKVCLRQQAQRARQEHLAAVGIAA